MYAWLVAAARRAPVTGRQLTGAAIVGLLLMFGGNGLVTRRRAGGAVGPRRPADRLGTAVGDPAADWYGRERVPGMTLVSVAVGFVGVALLVLPGDRPEGAPLGWSLLVVPRPSWASGSFAATAWSGRTIFLTTTAWQMLIGGAAMVVVGLALGELATCSWPRSAPTRGLAFVFLVFVGSIAAFTAYNWLLRHVAISTVATYAFVNPVIAVFLGRADPVRGGHRLRGGRHRRDRRVGRLRRAERRARRLRPRQTGRRHPARPPHSADQGKEVVLT